ncbi:hypothetical protein DH2020_035966 [Rehmannia glutinosa]|uniref:Uncharacterized protein n=1 Tax=Rehmannia glutinosa TaxID=99300 RepID=A0ABR0V7R9_REHGL
MYLYFSGMAEPAYTVASDSETTGDEKTSSPFPEIAIGIDIGTSQCSVAVWSGSQVELLRNTRNQKLMRSYVTFKDETPAGGVSNQLAHEYEMLSGAAIFNIKRLVGRVDTDPVVHASKSLPFLVQTLNIGVRPFIAALVKNMWRSTSPEEITRIERACAMAGLQVLRLMPEPTAVGALLYAQQQQQNVHENMGNKGLSGNALGGEDILLNTMHHLLPDMDSHFSTRGIEEIRKMGLLRVATQDAIHKLSSQSDVQIDVDLGNGRKICKVDEEDVNDVILVGGCSNIRLRNIITTVCKREPYTRINPLEAAVRGAALEGAVASGVNDPFGSLDLLTIQVAPLSIGIRADGNSFIPIIHQNTTMPVRRDVIFTTVHDNQAEALIIVYEGNEKTVEDNHLLGYFKITGIPPAPKGVPEINICLDIDASNVLRVFAGVIMPGGQNPASPVMEVRMPTVDDGHGWCSEALNRTYGSTLDLVTVQKKVAH